MSSIDSTSESGGRPPSDSPRSIEPRDATIRTPISPAACTSASQQPGPAAREDVVVVEHRRAAGQRQLGEAGAGGRVLGLGVDPRPHRVELDEPLEQRRLLRPGARQRLVQVVMGVDEPRRDDRAGRGRRPLSAAGGAPSSDRLDEPVAHEQPAVGEARRRSRPSCRSRRFAGAASSPLRPYPARPCHVAPRLHIVESRAFHGIGEELHEGAEVRAGRADRVPGTRGCDARRTRGGEAGQEVGRAVQGGLDLSGPVQRRRLVAGARRRPAVRAEGARRARSRRRTRTRPSRTRRSRRSSPVSSGTATR